MQSQSSAVIISVSGLDQMGVISEVTGFLFENGANLADTAFAVLGQGFEFTAVAECSDDTTPSDLEQGLTGLESLSEASVSVRPFPFGLDREDMGSITHFVEIMGGDKPGLIARISEVIQEYGANIVRMTSRRTETVHGTDYKTRFGLNVVGDKAKALENALYNTAGSLRLTCKMRRADL